MMMGYIILVFGVLILLAGVVILAKPESIFGILRSHSESLSVHILAVATRIVLGVALIVYAGDSKHPHILEILGWLTIAAAIGLGVIGRSNFKRLMKWALALALPYGRIGGVVAVLFGGFLVYAVL